MIAVRKSSVASVVDKVLEECAVLGKAASFRCLLRAGKKKKERATSEGGDYSHQPCPWLKACDPNMEPDVFCQSTGYNDRFMCMRTPTTSKKRRW